MLFLAFSYNSLNVILKMLIINSRKRKKIRIYLIFSVKQITYIKNYHKYKYISKNMDNISNLDLCKEKISRRKTPFHEMNLDL